MEPEDVRRNREALEEERREGMKQGDRVDPRSRPPTGAAGRDPRGAPPGLRPPAPNPGINGMAADMIGTLVHGDAWPEVREQVRERSVRIAEAELKAAKRKAAIESFGTSVAIVLLTCIVVLAVVGTGVALGKLLGW